MIFPSSIIQPKSIIFKPGSLSNLVKESLKFGNNGVVVYGSSFKKSDYFKKLEYPEGCGVRFYQYAGGEPDIQELTCLIDFLRIEKCDWAVGIGGGSVLDITKAAAGLYNAKHDPGYYQDGNILEAKGIPFIAVPTTAGTGSEVTRNSVISDKSRSLKASIRDNSFMAEMIILDCELLYSAPQKIIAYSGLDALTQAIESYISINSSWYSNEYSLQAFKLLINNLEKFYFNKNEVAAENILLGSFLAGVAFSSSRLGLIHGIAHPLGVIYKIPHGQLCGWLLPKVLKINKSVINEKYKFLSEISNMDLIQKIEELLHIFSIPDPFSSHSLVKKDIIIKQTLNSGSTAANPLKISEEHIDTLLKEIF